MLAAIWRQSILSSRKTRLISQRSSWLASSKPRIDSFPESGRIVPELGVVEIREVIHRPYRIVYRLVGADQLHVLTVHHSARRFPESL